MSDRYLDKIRQALLDKALNSALEKDKDNAQKVVNKENLQKKRAFFAKVNAALYVLIISLLKKRFQRKRAQELAARYKRYIKNKKLRRHVSRDESEEDQKRITAEAKKALKEKAAGPLPIAKEFGTTIENLITGYDKGILPSEGLLDLVFFLQEEGLSLVKNLSMTLVDTLLPSAAKTVINTSIQHVKENLARLDALLLKLDPTRKQQNAGELFFLQGRPQKREAVDEPEDSNLRKRPRQT